SAVRLHLSKGVYEVPSFHHLSVEAVPLALRHQLFSPPAFPPSCRLRPSGLQRIPAAVLGFRPISLWACVYFPGARVLLTSDSLPSAFFHSARVASVSNPRRPDRLSRRSGFT